MEDRASVRDTYDRIAAHFSQTREHPWPETESFLADRTEAVGLDLGCGNGRHTELLAAAADHAVGLDVSGGLLSEAVSRAENRGYDASWVQGDAARIPLDASVVDVAVYVATLHHLPSRDLRVASLDELARVLSPDGEALVSVWSTAHDRFDREAGFDTQISWTLPDGETVDRYYHIYDPDEFDADVDASALRVEETWLSSGNCYARVRGREGKRP